MNQLKLELEKNFKLFESELTKMVASSFEELSSKSSEFLASYTRLASLESWKAFVLESSISGEALKFYSEAQNDALLSHALARVGSWRSSLQSLRSAIENILYCLYYKDHPIEYRLWENGQHQIPISEYFSFLERHPEITTLGLNISGFAILKQEYSTLSKAVHGSAKSFQMTLAPKQFPNLMNLDHSLLGQWEARQNKVLQAINLIFTSIFSSCLQGSNLRDLRKSISLVLSAKQKSEVTKHLKIKLF